MPRIRASAAIAAFARLATLLGLAFGLGSALGILASAGPAAAFDVQLDARTSFQAYHVQSPGTSSFMARRRLVSSLGLRGSQALSEPDEEGRVIRLTVSFRLRVEQEFGETCLVDEDLCVQATDTEQTSEYHPLAEDTRVDLPHAFVTIDGLPYGLSASAGRLLRYDEIGFARVDGGSIELSPFPWLRLDLFGGLTVRATSLAGSDRFAPQGTVRRPLDPSLDPSRYPYIAPPSDLWAVGGGLSLSPATWLQLRVRFREAWEDSPISQGRVQRRVAFGATSRPHEALRLEAQAVLDLLTEELIRAYGAVEVQASEELRLSATVERHVPRFDPGTIWAWFSLAPIDQARLSFAWTLSPDVEIGAGLRGRRVELGKTEGEAAAGLPAEELDAGGDLYLRARWEGFRFDLSGFGWGGALGPLAGLNLDVRRPIVSFLSAELHLSLWHFEDPMRPGAQGPTVAEALGARFHLSPQAELLLELQHAASDRVGHRFRGLVTLQVETWR